MFDSAHLIESITYKNLVERLKSYKLYSQARSKSADDAAANAKEPAAPAKPNIPHEGPAFPFVI